MLNRYHSLFEIKSYSEDYTFDYRIGRPLIEATFEIDNDVELLFKKSNFKAILDSANKYLLQNMSESFKNKIKHKQDITFYETDTSELNDEDSKKAHAINPIKIYLGIYQKGSRYNTQEKTIHLSLNHSSLDLLVQRGMLGKQELRDVLGNSTSESIFSDFRSARVKSNIAHELSHWISDSLFNKHITKIVDLAIKLSDPEKLKLKQKDVNMTYFEIDAQIHGIKTLKKQRSSDWDTFTLNTIFLHYNSLRAILKDVYWKYGQDVLNIWLQNLIKRMHRERLLGKNMKKFPDIKKLTEQDFCV